MCNQGCKFGKTTELSRVNLVVATNSYYAGPPLPCDACTALIDVALGKASFKNEFGDLSSLAVILYYSTEEFGAVKICTCTGNRLPFTTSPT